MQENPEGDELDDSVIDDRRRCKNNSPVLFCIDKRTKESCDRGSKVGTVYGEPVFLRRPKESHKRDI